MLVIELTYKKSLEEVNILLEEHKSFLDKCYSEGLFIASGPKNSTRWWSNSDINR